MVDLDERKKQPKNGGLLKQRKNQKKRDGLDERKTPSK
jgi:hypothetical protein